MKMRISHLLLAMLLIVAFVGMAMAEEAKKEHDFVGVKKCKMCHKKDGIHAAWEASAHATAFEKLSDEDKKSEALLPFYTTGTTAKGVLLTGVQCEACHGGGADYKKKKIMSDREAAVAAGMVVPDEKTCMKCHNEKAPAALAATAKDFDFAKMWEKGGHGVAKKVEAK